MQPTIYELTISLIDSRPRIWRRVLVSGNVRLKKLHAIIQAVMPWTDSHLHMFIFPDTLYSDPTFYTEEDPDWPHIVDESQAVLKKVAVHSGCAFTYLYDYGDEWRHLIYVGHIGQNHPDYHGHPVCIGGGNACPPEDCGGMEMYYQEFLPAYLDPEHDEGLSTRRWAGEDFDPEVFDRDAANLRLSKLT